MSGRSKRLNNVGKESQLLCVSSRMFVVCVFSGGLFKLSPPASLFFLFFLEQHAEDSFAS